MPTMALHLFVGLRVRDFAVACAWYWQLFGEPTFYPPWTEAVWTLADDRSVYVVEVAEGAGSGVVTIFVENLDANGRRDRSPRVGACRGRDVLRRSHGDLSRS